MRDVRQNADLAGAARNAPYARCLILRVGEILCLATAGDLHVDRGGQAEIENFAAMSPGRNVKAVPR
jgi:hypothetical protein